MYIKKYTVGYIQQYRRKKDAHAFEIYSLSIKGNKLV